MGGEEKNDRGPDRSGTVGLRRAHAAGYAAGYRPTLVCASKVIPESPQRWSQSAGSTSSLNIAPGSPIVGYPSTRPTQG